MLLKNMTIIMSLKQLALYTPLFMGSLGLFLFRPILNTTFMVL